MLNEVWRIALFGGIQAHRRHVSIDRFRTRKTAALLAYLALHAGRSHSREMLATLLWPDAEPALGLKSLGVALSSLRKILEAPGAAAGAVVMGDRLSAGLSAGSVQTDVAEFTGAVESARSARSVDEQVAQLQAAVRGYTGDFAAGHLDDWILIERERLQVVYRRTLNTLTKILEQSGAAAEALSHALEIAVAESYDEEACLRVMRLYTATSRPGDAKRHFVTFADRLARDLGVQPSAALREFARGLGAASQAMPSIASEARSRPARPAEGSGLAQTRQPDAREDRLPVALTRLVGREEDVDTLQPLLGRRLLTLTGPGGVGKTRLAVEAVRRSALNSGRRALFAPLADVVGPTQVPAAIADTLGIAVPPGPFDEGQLFRALESASTTLLLDNAEHLLDDTGAGSLSAFVQQLLERAPSVHVVVTSRQPLGLDGEQAFPVRPLATPADTESPVSKDLAGCACVELFVDRARLKQPDFQVTARNAPAVAELCSRLDGIPLAIELAAGLIRVLPPRQLAIRLRQTQQDLVNRKPGANARHASLSSVMDWSFRLLPARLQESFCHLSVLRGTWSVEAAHTICGGDAIEVIDLLCDRSLIQPEIVDEQPRYRMLETIRSYASAELDERGHATEARRRHAEYFTAFASLHRLRYRMPELGPGERRAVDALSDQYPNVSAALDWRLAATPADPDVWPMAAMLSRFWFLSRRLGEGNERLQAILAAARQSADPDSLCTLLNHAGSIAWFLGDYSRAQELARELLVEARRHRLPEHEATGLHSFGVFAGVLGDAGSRDATLADAVGRFRSIGDAEHLGWCLMSHGWLLLLSQGDDARAASLLEQAIAVYEAAGERLQRGWCQMYLALIACRSGDTRAADRLSREGLAAFHEHRSASGQLWMLLHMATIALAAGDCHRAGMLAGHVDALLARSGTQLPPAEHAERERVLAGVREALGDRAAMDAHASGSGLSAEQAFEYASGPPVGLV